MKKITLLLVGITALVLTTMIYTACKKNDRVAKTPDPLITASKIEDLTEQELRIIAEDEDVKKLDALTIKAATILENAFSLGKLDIKEIKKLNNQRRFKEINDIISKNLPELTILADETALAKKNMLEKFPVLNTSQCNTCSNFEERATNALNVIDNKLNSPTGSNNAKVCNRSCRWCVAYAKYLACLTLCTQTGWFYPLCAFLCLADYCKW